VTAEEGSLEVTAEEVSCSLALISKEESLGKAAVEDGASGIIVRCACTSEAK
jgi:hypothetical protein